MNAKKIMGAVLVALLAAALFVGAGAAATDYGTVFVYQNLSKVPAGNNAVPADGVWQYGAAQITISDKIVYPGANFVPGTYKNGGDSVYVTYPTASYAVSGKIGGKNYLVANGGTVYANSTSFPSKITPTITSVGKVGIKEYLLTYPSGKALKTNLTYLSGSNLTQDKGTYKIQAIFDGSKFVAGAPENYLVDTLGALTFTVVGTDDATISASANTVYAGETLTVTIKGTPGTVYNLELDGFETPELKQLVTLKVDGGKYNFTMPNNGEASFQLTVGISVTDKATVKLFEGTKTPELKTVEITVSAAVVTATLGAPSYFVGDTVVISGTSTAGIDESYMFYITGTNFAATNLSAINDAVKFEKKGKTWEVKINTALITEGGVNNKKLDVGTYTISIEKPINVADKNVVIKTVAVALKQPFISILEAPTTVAQKTEAKFIVNAEATKAAVKAYVFGQNYFLEVKDKQIAKTEKDVENKFTITLTKDNTSKENMSTGEYFLVIQHPMYDGKFNIMPLNGTFYLNTSGNAVNASETTDAAKIGKSSKLFDVYDRQTANAAQALCDALDTQNIDDMYVKYSFFVVGQDASFSISEIPSEVTKGTQIVISGVDTANAEGVVVVEMLSTRFAAVPKEDVNAAAFIVVTADIAKDGTWEVVLDTSDLAIDEYGVSVKTGKSVKKNIIVNVIEGAPVTPTDDPTVVPTDAPVTPTEAPKTPGFGALAALAGLGAVAVLLLRRE